MGSPVRAEAGLRLAASRISYWLFHANLVEGCDAPCLTNFRTLDSGVDVSRSK